MIYKNRDTKGQSQCYPVDSRDKTSNMNTGVTKNQMKESNITYNNSIFNPMYTLNQLQPNGGSNYNTREDKGDVNAEIVTCS